MSDTPLERYEGLLDVYDRDLEWARLKLAKQITTLVTEFPPEAFDEPEPPPRWVTPTVSLRLFELGAFRQVWLEPLSGQTTLLIGQNLRLYEYGPAYLRLHEPYVENTICVRGLSIGRLDYADLLMCRELLNRIWI